MIHSNRLIKLLILDICLLCVAGAVFGAPPSPPANPAKIQVEIEPGSVAAGSEATVTIRLEPIKGVKIARYPQIRLQVAEQPGLVLAANTAIGDKRPPAPEELENNYWGEITPLVLKLQIDPEAKSGPQEVQAKLRYNFCVNATYCAPARVPLTLNVEVE